MSKWTWRAIGTGSVVTWGVSAATEHYLDPVQVILLGVWSGCFASLITAWLATLRLARHRGV